MKDVPMFVLTVVVVTGMVFILWALYQWTIEERRRKRARKSTITLVALHSEHRPEMTVVSKSWWIKFGATPAIAAKQEMQRRKIELHLSQRSSTNF